MKACGFLCVFLLSVAIAMALPHCVQAQQRGVVGVGLTLKPIQTLHVVADSLRGGGKQVASFGTSAYGVSIDRITADSLAVLRNGAVRHVSSGDLPKAADQRRPGNPLSADKDQTLVVYSIRVH